MTRIRRGLYRITEILDYRTFVVATGFLALLLVGYLVVSSIQQAHDATDSANRRGAAASRRIDLLNTEIQQLQARIAAGQDERGQLAAAVNALRAQIEQLGGRPVASPAPTTVFVTIRQEPQASSQPSPTPRPSPKPTSHPTSSPSPRPSPSPTCRPLPIIGCRKAHR